MGVKGNDARQLKATGNSNLNKSVLAVIMDNFKIKLEDIYSEYNFKHELEYYKNAEVDKEKIESLTILYKSQVKQQQYLDELRARNPDGSYKNIERLRDIKAFFELSKTQMEEAIVDKCIKLRLIRK